MWLKRGGAREQRGAGLTCTTQIAVGSAWNLAARPAMAEDQVSGKLWDEFSTESESEDGSAEDAGESSSEPEDDSFLDDLTLQIREEVRPPAPNPRARGDRY